LLESTQGFEKAVPACDRDLFELSGDALPVGPMLLAMLAAGLVHQDPPHRFRRGREEMTAAGPALPVIDIHQP
jgi:hypothetical protein